MPWCVALPHITCELSEEEVLTKSDHSHGASDHRETDGLSDHSQRKRDGFGVHGAAVGSSWWLRQPVRQRSVASHTIMSTDKSSRVANETTASDADGSGYDERLSDLSDHELTKHMMNELSSLLAGLGIPGKRPSQQNQKAFKKKTIPKPLNDAIHALIKMRITLVHFGPARAGLPDRNKFIELFFDVKVWLLGLAQLEKIPIRAQAGRSPQGFEDALGDDIE